MADGKKRKARRPLHKNKKDKRAKTDAAADDVPQAARGPRRAVTAEDLKWKPVEMPDAFDDADGFMGLEVIENVEIIRDGKNVRFVTSDLLEKDETEFEGFDDDDGDDDAPADTEKAADNTDSPAVEDATKKTGKTTEKTLEKKTKKEKKKAEEPKDADKTAGKVTEAKETGQAAKKLAKEAPAKKTTDSGADDAKAAKKKGKKTAANDEELALELGKGGAGGFAVLADDVEDVVEDGADVSAWVPLNLPPQLLSCLARLKFTKPTTIQAKSIPAIMAGHDVIGKASTGSGKTLAFSIPIVQRWLSLNGSADAIKKKTKKTPLALIMSPTRELAHQIATHIKNLCAALPTAPYVCSITGGLSTYKQQRQLELADIVVGTPGRLWEVLSGNAALLRGFRAIQFLVVDEADRLLADGHFAEAEEILLALDHKETKEEYDAAGGDDDEDDDDEDDNDKRKPRQTLVFSATFNKGLQQKLSGKGRYDLADEAESMEHLLKRLNFREETPKFIDANPISQMARRLNKKPIIYAGQGIILSEGGPEILKELADKSSIPVTTTLQGLGAYDELDEKSLHMLGMHGSAYANMAMQEADLIIALGARFDDRVTLSIAKFAPGAKAAAAEGRGGIVHFEIMPKNINKVVQATEAIEGDVATNLKELLPLIESKTMEDRKEWFNKINEWKKKWPLTDYERAERSGLIKPQTLIEELSNLVADRKDKTYIATGVGQHQMWTAQHFRWRHPRSMITSGGLGTMGYGLPAAIGAKVAQPDALVIDIDGDASFNMTLTELSTAAQFNIGVKVIVLNNEEQGMVTQWQNIFYEDRYAHTHQSNPDFIKLAEAMRVQNRRVSKPEDVVDALKWLINTDGPALLEVVTDKKVPVLPMVPVGSGLHEFLVFDGAKDKKRRELMRERTCGLHG